MTKQSFDHFENLLKKSLRQEEENWHTIQQSTSTSNIGRQPIERSSTAGKKTLFWYGATFFLLIIGAFFLLKLLIAYF